MLASRIDRSSLTAGWVIPIVILFVISFPPLFGHEVSKVVCALDLPADEADCYHSDWCCLGIVGGIWYHCCRSVRVDQPLLS